MLNADTAVPDIKVAAETAAECAAFAFTIDMHLN